MGSSSGCRFCRFGKSFGAVPMHQDEADAAFALSASGQWSIHTFSIMYDKAKLSWMSAIRDGIFTRLSTYCANARRCIGSRYAYWPLSSCIPLLGHATARNLVCSRDQGLPGAKALAVRVKNRFEAVQPSKSSRVFLFLHFLAAGTAGLLKAVAQRAAGSVPQPRQRRVPRTVQHAAALCRGVIGIWWARAQAWGLCLVGGVAQPDVRSAGNNR